MVTLFQQCLHLSTMALVFVRKNFISVTDRGGKVVASFVLETAALASLWQLHISA